MPLAIKELSEKGMRLKLKDYLIFSLPGILNVVISMLLLQLAISYGKASLVAIIVSMNPLFVSIFAYFILKENLDKRHIISITIALIGLVLIIASERDLGRQNYQLLSLGIIFAILAGLTFALYTVLTKRIINTYGNLLTNSMSFLIGSFVLFIINAFIGKSLIFEFNLRNILLMFYLGAFISGIAYLLYFAAMKELGAGKTSLYFFLKPALASVLAFIFLGENLTVLQLFGIVMVMIALSNSIWKKRSE